MSGPTVVALGVIAVLSLGAQQPTKVGKIVSVEIIVDTLPGHQKRCKGGGVKVPSTVLVTDKEVRYCVGNELITHDDAHKKFEATLVQVSAGDRVRWYSKATQLGNVQIQMHQPITKGAPNYPFVEPMSKGLANEVTSPPVRDVEGNVTQRYKISFDIGKVGNRVDPDVVCSM